MPLAMASLKGLAKSSAAWESAAFRRPTWSTLLLMASGRSRAMVPDAPSISALSLSRLSSTPALNR